MPFRTGGATLTIVSPFSGADSYLPSLEREPFQTLAFVTVPAQGGNKSVREGALGADTRHESQAPSPTSPAGFYPAFALTKKPISGKPGAGAYFVSFNFTNKLICKKPQPKEQAPRL